MFFELRSNERNEFPDHKVEYCLGNFTNDEIFEADLINASETGLCMLSPHCLSVGQKITLRNFMGSSSRTAVVIWIAQDKEASSFDKSDQVLFKIGLQFSD
jgi:hypothetical protein